MKHFDWIELALVLWIANQIALFQHSLRYTIVYDIGSGLKMVNFTTGISFFLSMLQKYLSLELA